MKLIIVNEHFSKSEIIEDATIIPRVGERVKLWYQPWPTVKNVLHSFDSGEVVVYAD